MVIGSREAAEQRLLACFSKAAAEPFSRETMAPTEPPRVMEPGTGEPDTPRIKLAIEQLALLAEQRRDGLVAKDHWSRIADDLALSAEVGRAIAAGSSLPPLQRTPYVAELMIASDGSRPATLIRNGEPWAPGQLGEFGGRITNFMDDLPRSVAATGRICHDGRHLATGMLIEGPVGQPQLLTAAHAIARFRRSDARLGQKLYVDFVGEVGATRAVRHELIEVIAMGNPEQDETDYALLRFGDPLDDVDLPACVLLEPDPMAVAHPSTVGVISYPGRPSVRAAEVADNRVWARLFEGIWNVKRLSPAFTVAGASPPLVWHNATTTEGSSGGALIAGSGGVAAMHLGGRIDAYNYALQLASIARTGVP